MKMRSAILALAIAVAAASEASAFDPPPPDTRLYTLSDLPADPLLAAPYLDDSAQTGTATVSCEIGNDQRYTQCYIVEETPAGKGFADAAMKILLTKGRSGGTPGLWIEHGYEYRPPNPEFRYHTLADFPDLPEKPNDMNLYPPRARTEEIEGSGTVECVMGDNGRYESCAVLSESPKGYDFGKATAAFFLSAVRSASPRGTVERITMKWVF